MEGMPDSLTAWVKYAQTYYARWTMAKAYGYTGKREDTGKGKPKWNLHKRSTEKDPNAMDVDYTYMDASKKKKLMKPSSCFCCKKQGHLAREYPSKGMTLV